MSAELKPWQFKPGNPGGGRPVGARSKLSETFLQALAADFAEHGQAAIVKVRAERPHHYLSVVANLCPRELRVERHSPFSDLSDQEIDLLEAFLKSNRARDVTEINGEAVDQLDTKQHDQP
jgi:hypothetical protein